MFLIGTGSVIRKLCVTRAKAGARLLQNFPLSFHYHLLYHYQLPDSAVVFVQCPFVQEAFFRHRLFAFQFSMICSWLFFSQILRPGCCSERQGLLSNPIKKEWRKAFFPAKHGDFWNDMLRIHTSVFAFFLLLWTWNVSCSWQCTNRRLNQISLSLSASKQQQKSFFRKYYPVHFLFLAER